MINLGRILLFTILVNISLVLIAQVTDPSEILKKTANQRLRRADSFLGFHFDFHATDSDKELGKDFDPYLLEEFLRRTKPDYIQIDSKGHPGYSSYPTKIGYSANSFVKDPMRIWRDATNKFNIPLYIHYSGIWDKKAIRENPQWGRIKADGTIDSTKAAYLGEYSEKLMIPQLKEMIDNYKIDGAWIDGDCWSTEPDYSPEVIKGFLTETGLKEVPVAAKDPVYKKWLDYNRIIYRKYLKNYIDKLHIYNPDFQIASNWAYSSMMPEKVDVNVDFLSGDVSPSNNVYSSAYQARCLALQGKPWDLMAWSFVPIDFMGGIHSPKSLVQLEQEAAEVMAMGGGFQVYFQQNRDASFRAIDTDAMVKLAAFCRERQPFCQHSEIIPQIGMWYSVEGWKMGNDGVYGWSSTMDGITNLLLDSQYPVEILMDHQLKDRLNKYPLMIIPEWDQFDVTLKEQLLKYIAAGGNALIIGAKATKAFEGELNVSFVGKDSTRQFNMGGKNAGGIAGIKTNWQKVIPKPGTQVEGHVFSQCDYRYPTQFPVATINNYGKGKIAAFYMDFSAAYNQYRNPVFNKLLRNVINILIPDPDLRVTGSGYVHVVLGKKNDKTFIHLINSSGEHFNKSVMAYDELLPTRSLILSYKTNIKPVSVTLQPSGGKINVKQIGDRIEFVVPPVEVHSIIEIKQ